MSERKTVILQPEYMKEFNCIGSACEDTCCAGWKVELDKKTYQSYLKIKDKELKELVAESVNRKRSEKSDAAYGKIKMKKDGSCPFLDQDRLCRIQLIKGEGFLSETCTVYPRIFNRIDGRTEQSANYSCPEVVRLALFKEQGMVFENAEEVMNPKYKVKRILDTEGHLFYNKPQRYFWEIRLFSLGLLQNRSYSMGERLIILGIVYKKIEELQKEGKISELERVLEAMSDLIEAGTIREELDRVPVNNQIQLRIAKELTDIKVNEGIASIGYLRLLNEALLGISYIEGGNLDNVLQKYEENYRNYLAPYLQNKEYILENYLVNEYFKEIMPFGRFKTIWESYVFLCTLYSMLKLHLIGLAGYHKEMNDELAGKLVQSFSKVILHNDKYIKTVNKMLKENSYDTLAYMSILVKN